MNQEQLLKNDHSNWNQPQEQEQETPTQHPAYENQEESQSSSDQIGTGDSVSIPKQELKNDQPEDQIEKTESNDEERGEFFNPILPFFSLEIAKVHAKANRVFQEDKERSTMSEASNINASEICPCCFNVILPESELIPVWKSTYQDFAHLGPTYPMYFQFMKYSIFFITIIFLVSGIYNLVANSKGDYCQELSDSYPNDPNKSCNVSFIQTVAGSNRYSNSPDVVNAVLNLITSIFMMAFTVYFRIRQIKFEAEIDKSDISVSDYTVFVHRIPLNKTRYDIINFIESQVSGVKVEKVVKAYKMKKLNDLNEKLLNAKSTTEINKILNQIDQYEEQCTSDDVINDNTFCGGAFVSFEKEDQKEKVIDHFKYSPWRQYFKIQKMDSNKLFDGSQLHVVEGKEPGDVNWENIEFTGKQKLIRRAFTLFLTLCLLGLSFWAIFEIGDAQGEINKKATTDDSVKITVISTFSSILTVLINQILQAVISYSADYEIYNFKTDTVISIAKKSGIAQFINTTIVSFFVMVILNGRSIWINGGLVNSITTIAITNAIAPAAISYVSPENIIQWVEQKIFLKLSKHKQQKVSQAFVHGIFELPQFSPAACFAAAANVLLFAAFYARIIPIALPFCAVSLVLQYIVNKYKLLRRQSIPIPLGTDLPEEMNDFYFEMIILLYSLGCLAFEIILYNETHVCTILMVIFSGIFYIAPINEYIDKKLNSESNYIEQLTYIEAQQQGQFSTDYDRFNPVLKGKQIEKYVNRLIEKETSSSKRQQLINVFYLPTSKLAKQKTSDLKDKTNQKSINIESLTVSYPENKIKN